MLTLNYQSNFFKIDSAVKKCIVNIDTRFVEEVKAHVVNASNIDFKTQRTVQNPFSGTTERFACSKLFTGLGNALINY